MEFRLRGSDGVVEGVETYANWYVKRYIVQATAARGAGAWGYASLSHDQSFIILPQKQATFSVTIRQNGGSRAKTGIVTEKSGDSCGTTANVTEVLLSPPSYQER